MEDCQESLLLATVPLIEQRPQSNAHAPCAPRRLHATTAPCRLLICRRKPAPGLRVQSPGLEEQRPAIQPPPRLSLPSHPSRTRVSSLRQRAPAHATPRLRGSTRPRSVTRRPAPGRGAALARPPRTSPAFAGRAPRCSPAHRQARGQPDRRATRSSPSAAAPPSAAAAPFRATRPLLSAQRDHPLRATRLPLSAQAANRQRRGPSHSPTRTPRASPGQRFARTAT
jgi:hypothetical protein